MSCEGWWFPSTGSLLITLKLFRCLGFNCHSTKSSAKGHQLPRNYFFFQIHITWNLHICTRRWMVFHFPLHSICQIIACSWMHNVSNKAACCSLYHSDIQGSESIVILCPILNSLHHWAMASVWALIQCDSYYCKQATILNIYYRGQTQ